LVDSLGPNCYNMGIVKQKERDMSEKASMFVFMVGLLLTAFGVGGVEQSMDDMGLLYGVLVSAVGCAIMWCGTLGLRNADYYGR